eukprot:2723555-Rhodomonas_salina.1
MTGPAHLRPGPLLAACSSCGGVLAALLVAQLVLLVCVLLLGLFLGRRMRQHARRLLEHFDQVPQPWQRPPSPGAHQPTALLEPRQRHRNQRRHVHFRLRKPQQPD